MPNAMWKKRAFGQLEKCAEAMALRRAFPELGAAATADEMEGKTIEHDDLPAVPAIEGPKARPQAPNLAPGGPSSESGERTEHVGAVSAPATAKPATTRTSEELLNHTK